MYVLFSWEGFWYIVDEVDKAPTNVTCILKNIIGRGDVTLADGRRIVHNGKSVYLLLTYTSRQYLNSMQENSISIVDTFPMLIKILF